MRVTVLSFVPLVALAVSLSCGSPSAPTPSQTVTPTPAPTPTPRLDGRTEVAFSGRYELESNTYIFSSGPFAIQVAGPVDVQAQASEPTGSYQFAVLRLNSPTNCSGVVAYTALADGASQSGHWDSIGAGSYCINMLRSPKDRSYTWSGKIIHP